MIHYVAPMLVFSCDMDWAPDEVIVDTLSLFENYGIRATLFATNVTPVLRDARRDLFEVGIHPNFNPILEGKKGDVDSVLTEILSWYPDAKGVRSHSMTQSTYILGRFKQFGLHYDANHFLPYMKSIQPYRLWNGLVKIPYVWEDDVHYLYGRDFKSSGLDFSDPGLKVVDFHPIHVFLNTENAARYQAAKTHYQDPKMLLEFRNRGPVPGTRDMLIELLERAKSQPSVTLGEIAAQVPQ